MPNLQKIIIANWKANMNKKDIYNYISKLNKNFNFSKDSSCHNVIISPSYIYLDYLNSLNNNKQFNIAAQNISDVKSGAATGEVTPNMLKDYNINYAIIGHSERRNLYKEDNQLIKKKINLAINSHINPILCIGEDISIRKSNQIKEFLINQLDSNLDNNLRNKQLKDIKIIIAYEPIWSIGTNTTPSIKEITYVIDLIREYLSNFISKDNYYILYGGSVNDKNYQDILSIDNLDGLLIGGASLDIDKFLTIIS